jgi:lipid A 4'-phosphatase
MNRTGLLIALSVAAVVGLVFGLYPDLDLRLASLFFNPESKRFLQFHHPWMMDVRDATMWLVTAMVLVPVGAFALKALWPRRPLLVPARAILFLSLTMALGPGLVVNAGLKENWNRSRPVDVPQLAGSEKFTPWWDVRGGCEKNCSFVSGDSAGAFWTLAPAALAPPQWRPVAYAGALAFGSFVGLLRMAFGGHFFTDVIFSGVFVFLVIWLVHGLIYRWPRTRLDEQAAEGWMERTALSGYARLGRLFGARRTPERH